MAASAVSHLCKHPSYQTSVEAEFPLGSFTFSPMLLQELLRLHVQPAAIHDVAPKKHYLRSDDDEEEEAEARPVCLDD